MRYRNDQTGDGQQLRTEVVPATGTYIDMFDLYGNRYWYDLRTENITFNADELREVRRCCVSVYKYWSRKRPGTRIDVFALRFLFSC